MTILHPLKVDLGECGDEFPPPTDGEVIIGLEDEMIIGGVPDVTRTNLVIIDLEQVSMGAVVALSITAAKKFHTALGQTIDRAVQLGQSAKPHKSRRQRREAAHG